jgi:3-oxoacyl-[acyl-carrier-protein] synthase-3
MIHAVITATGCYIPEVEIENQYFAGNSFLEKDGTPVKKPGDVLIRKLTEISGIERRRYAQKGQLTSDIAALAAEAALSENGTDRETLDYIIVAHNFGDVSDSSSTVNIVPSVASKVKNYLGIKNPDCVAYDLPFGCPGWVEAMIQANYYIRSGDAKRCLVIGADIMSRVLDPYDRDSMLFSDGSGAAILEASEGPAGIIAHKTRTFADENNLLIDMGASLNPDYKPDELTIKMNGRKVYEFALSHVPALIRDLLDQHQIPLTSISKVLIHQANEKMDAAILERLFKLYNITDIPSDIMPMTISWLGNSSVATIPTMLDLIRKGQLPGHQINAGDRVIFASVGAGMSINALVYQA